MRHLFCLLLALTAASPALAGSPYTPLKLAPGKTVTPPPELVRDATAFLEALKSGDGDAIAAGMAPKVTTLNGAIELAIPRHKEVVGPFDTIEDMLVRLSGNIGGILPSDANGVVSPKVAIDGERDYIVQALTDGRPWGTDPMVKGAICTYAYRSYDIEGLKALAARIDTESSSFVFVDKPYELRASPDKSADVVATMQPDLLYGLDYDTDAPIGWIAVHLPEGGSAFANHDEAQFDKPYAAGVCFDQNKDGRWVMVAQSDTSL